VKYAGTWPLRHWWYIVCLRQLAGRGDALSVNRSLYISHGGGPLPLLGDPGHAEMVAQLRAIAGSIGKPSAIIVASAHWEASVATVTAAAEPELIYDYYGFPEASYAIEYPAVGDPALATGVADALADQGIDVQLDDGRGFDHGMFVPLKIMWPDADIPVVQISLLQSLDAEAHLRMGQALQSLPARNLLLIGSGFSFHNMQAFFNHDAEVARRNEAFERWLVDTCSNRQMDEQTRRQRLIEWESAPEARFCHPREEHLLPLHICYGMAERACEQVYELTILNKRTSMYLWTL